MMYIDRLYAIPVQQGTKKLTLTILTHYRGFFPVRFEFYKNNDSWMMYWIAELPYSELIAVARAYSVRLPEWEKSPNGQALRNAILRQHRTKNSSAKTREV